MTNQLYYGDNLQVLRDSIATECVNLVYLDPPSNSQANYNINGLAHGLNISNLSSLHRECGRTDLSTVCTIQSGI